MAAVGLSDRVWNPSGAVRASGFSFCLRNDGVVKMKCYLFDIDGTIANIDHRLHHIQKDPVDWEAFYDACDRDRPIAHMLDICDSLSSDAEIIFVTGRSERCREATMRWLKRHLPSGASWTWSEDSRRDLYMRADGDHRADNIVKTELLDRILDDGYEPIMAFEDRTQVVKMWRDRGIPCAQVAPGDF